LWIIIEAKRGETPKLVDMPADAGTAPGDSQAAYRWAWVCVIALQSEKNQCAELSIALQQRWWGKGYGEGDPVFGTELSV
jgi:hypothetical protein